MHPGAAVDLRRPLPCQDADLRVGAHGSNASGTGVTDEEHPASAGDRPRRRRGQAARRRSPPTARSRPCRSAGSTGSSTSCSPTWSTPAYLRIVVLTQYKSHSLDRHITTTWRMSTLLGDYVTPVPAQQRLGPQWFRGSADAIYQSLNLVYDERPDHVVRVRRRPRLPDGPAADGRAAHRQRGRRDGGRASACRAPRPASFGVIEPRADGGASRRSSRSRPTRPGFPTSPDERLRLDGQLRLHHRGAARRACSATPPTRAPPTTWAATSSRCWSTRAGRRSTTSATTSCPASTDRDRGYWRDVGTLDSYYDAHMDLIAVHPIFNLYNRQWPILTPTGSLPPAKFVFDEEGRRGTALDSMVSPGVDRLRGHGAPLDHLLGCDVHAGAEVEDSVLMHDVASAAGPWCARAILDKNVVVVRGAPSGSTTRRPRQRLYRHRGRRHGDRQGRAVTPA